MGSRLKVGLIVSATWAVLLAGAAAAEAALYWTNLGGTTIGRSNNNGTGVNQSFVTGAKGPCGIASDGQFIYWMNSDDGTMGRANVDGSQVNQNFITGIPGFPCGVGVDDQHLYWTTGNETSNFIGRANKNGSGIDNEFIDPLNPVCGVTADDSHIYWAHSPGEDLASGIGRATLAGGFIESNWVNIPIGNPCGVAVNSTHLFWGGGNNAIGRVDIDGDNADQEFIGGLDGYACGGAIDATSIFWSHENGNVGRANLDGSNVNDLFVTGGNEPCGVAVDSVTGAGKPSNAFTIGKLKLNKKKGTGKLAVTVPGAGQLALKGKNLKAQKATATVGGTISLKVMAAKKGKKKLRKKGKLKTTAKVTFSPTGGDPATQQKKVKLKRKRPKRK